MPCLERDTSRGISEENRCRDLRSLTAKQRGLVVATEPAPEKAVGRSERETKYGLAICASGFVPPVEIQVAELVGLRERADVEREGWLATSECFLRTNMGHEGELVFRKEGVTTTDAFFACLERSTQAISHVVFLGHGNASGALGLAGIIQRQVNVDITVSVRKSDIDAVTRNRERVAAIRATFTSEAVCDLCTCDVGRNADFLQSLADLLDRPVRALKGKVVWKRELITLQLGRDRGKTRVQPSGLLAYYDYDEKGITRRWGFDPDPGMTVQQLFDTLRPAPVEPRRVTGR